jgi:hypothetical protein
MRLTFACPEALRDDANHLAMVLAEGKPDGNTYGDLNWQDAAGNLYAAASFTVRPEWIAGATSPLQRPEWDTGNLVNMAGARRAQATLVVWLGGDDPVPQAMPGKLTVVAGDNGRAALEAMGLVADRGKE